MNEKKANKKRAIQLWTVLGSVVFLLMVGICCFRFMTSEGDGANFDESGDVTDAMEAESTVDENVAPSEEMVSALAPLDIDTLQVGDIISISDVETDPSALFKMYEISPNDAIYQRIIGKSYIENDNIALSDLRYLKLLHYNFDHEIQVGEMIVNVDVSEDVLSVFEELFAAEYEIESMRLIDDFWMGDGSASDDESIRHNNTSAFCYRYMSRSTKLSNHALGRAIDVNPRQNPYIWFDKDGTTHWSTEDAEQYLDRDSGAAHLIVKGDICYNTFTKYGFSWGGSWTNPVDYQHFEKK